MKEGSRIVAAGAVVTAIAVAVTLYTLLGMRSPALAAFFGLYAFVLAGLTLLARHLLRPSSGGWDDGGSRRPDDDPPPWWPEFERQFRQYAERHRGSLR